MKSDPKSTAMFLAIVAFLFKFSRIDQWWLWFAVVVLVLGQFGYILSMFGLIVALVIWQVLKDLFDRR